MIFVLLALGAATVSNSANLVLVYLGHPPTVVEYRSLARCERAKKALLDQAEQQGVNQGTVASGKVIRRDVEAYCIPS